MSETSETRGADLLMVGIPGKTLDGASREKLRALSPGALVLRPENVDDDVEDFAKLIADLHELLPDALFAVDAEGGRVDALKAVTGGAPSPAELAAGSPSLAFETGRWLGHALATFDFELALAPVVDLDRGEENNALDGRYLGSDPEAVTTRARAFLRGLHTAGIGGCLKHFPGLGGATDDTHVMGSTVYLPKRELERDLVPFRELAAFAGAVMVGHANYPAYDRDGLPATLSPALLADLLRRELGFEGVVLSDDLEMQALADWGSVADRAAAAFAAGCDLLLVCHDLDAAAAAAERLDAPEFATLRAQAGGRLARLREDLRALAVRHEQERVDAGVIRGYDFEEVYDKLESLRQAAQRAAEERAARAAEEPRPAVASAEAPVAAVVPGESAP
ncbi:MAG TPA: glycoside hydrolase family 3 N-terminal domain-containing protein [Thermoanaerobaculia bacterium]|nr:glycoside hydrolase family 3 N-terminal domain-containing protein [Thermoanaerobaculia bacterium]